MSSESGTSRPALASSYRKSGYLAAFFMLLKCGLKTQGFRVSCTPPAQESPGDQSPALETAHTPMLFIAVNPSKLGLTYKKSPRNTCGGSDWYWARDLLRYSSPLTNDKGPFR